MSFQEMGLASLLDSLEYSPPHHAWPRSRSKSAKAIVPLRLLTVGELGVAWAVMRLTRGSQGPAYREQQLYERGSLEPTCFKPECPVVYLVKPGVPSSAEVNCVPFLSFVSKVST